MPTRMFQNAPIYSTEDAANFLFKEFYRKLGISLRGNKGKNLGNVNIILQDRTVGKLALGKGRRRLTLKEMRDGIRELYHTLSSKTIMYRLVRKTFIDIVLPVMKSRWEEAGGNVFGRGGKQRVDLNLESALGGKAGPQVTQTESGWEVKFKNKKPAGSLTRGGLRIGRMLTESDSIKKSGPMSVGLPSLDDLLSIRIPSANSAFNSVFMMLEFGTGPFALPAPRLYAGLINTPFKVHPALGADPGSWFPNETLAAWAAAFAMQEFASKESRKLQGITARFTPNERKQVHKIREGLQEGRNRFGTGLNFDLFWAKGGNFMQPRSVIYTQRGIASQIRRALKDSQGYLISLINQRVKKKSPNFPNIKLSTGATPSIKGTTVSIE